MVTAKGQHYLQWLKHFYPKNYHFLMIEKGMVKELFDEGAKKLGIIAHFKVVKEDKKDNSQLSIFDTINDDDKYNQVPMSSGDIYKKYPLEAMERMIIKRPCKFLA